MLKSKHLLSTLLASFILFGYILNPTILNACETVAECDAQLDEINQKISDAEAIIAKGKESEADLLAQIKAYNEKITLSTEQITTLESTITTLANEIVRKEDEIKEKDEIIVKQLQVQQTQQNNNSFLTLLFSSTSLSDFMRKWAVVETLSANEKELLDELAKIKAEIESDRQKSEEKKSALEATKTSLETSKAEKETLVHEVHALMDQQEELLRNYYESEDEIARQKEIINRPPPEEHVPDGQWYLPVGNGARVTTHFWEIYEYGDDPHLGTDIADDVNTPIYPMADGYVMRAEWNDTFGNFVVVGHNIDGTQYVSMYAHMNYLNVGVGQYVYGGSSLIGGMGDTGFSFGEHLHLELAERDYFTLNRGERERTNIDALGKLPWWRSAYYE